MTAFELVAKLVADTSAYDSAMSKAERSGKGLQGSLENTFGKIKKAAAGALSVAAIKKGIDTVIEFAGEVSAAGDRIDKQSQVLGLSRKAYQEWDYILSQNGASIDSMNMGMKTLNNLVLDAAKGGKESKNAFAELGVSYKELDKLSQEDQFEAVVRAFQKMPAGAQKSALAVKIFGRNGMELLPMLNQSETSIDELRQRAEELGLIMSDDAVDAAGVYGDSLDDLQRTFTGFKNAIGAKILPILTTGIQKVTNYAGKLRKAYDEKGLAGVWDTLVTDFKNIKWPTQEEILGKISEMWNGVKEAATNVLKLVFGESADGGIAWPTPEDIKEKVRTGLTDMWNGVKGLAGGIMKLIFGEDEDGGIAWPTADEIWAKISSTVETWWDMLKAKIEGVLSFVLGVPDLPDAHTAGTMLREKLVEWWNTVKNAIKGIFSWLIPNPDMQDEQGSAMSKTIKSWWNDKILPAIKDALNFTLGLFGLPSVDEMAAKISAWWEQVKATVGQLVLNATVNPVRNLFGQDSIELEGSSVDASGRNSSGYGGGSHGFAKGLSYVPYDNYRTRLHRGEMVLTASQARRYRQGDSGLNMAQLTSGIVSSIREGMDGAQVNSYMDTSRVSAKTNSVTGRKLTAGRFAP